MYCTPKILQAQVDSKACRDHGKRSESVNNNYEVKVIPLNKWPCMAKIIHCSYLHPRSLPFPGTSTDWWPTRVIHCTVVAAFDLHRKEWIFWLRRQFLEPIVPAQHVHMSVLLLVSAHCMDSISSPSLHCSLHGLNLITLSALLTAWTHHPSRSALFMVHGLTTLSALHAHCMDSSRSLHCSWWMDSPPLCTAHCMDSSPCLHAALSVWTHHPLCSAHTHSNSHALWDGPLLCLRLGMASAFGARQWKSQGCMERCPG